ncbi:hypothetical protein BC936DRAFT_144308 [Jimgerdemannia flammicorona]|uniref:Uncharacterized protein n=1 Tax=Jimgerdemannia flammicorona TaxID=994334 RepID=A0A433DCQ2_9FUNG|nr:hypothetical protein BC936DRAFT_144308 [Jimgerdemannia flammicorona]
MVSVLNILALLFEKRGTTRRSRCTNGCWRFVKRHWYQSTQT